MHDGTTRILVLVLFDVDYFKRVNDTFGHPVGDEVLIEIARAVRRLVRNEDVFARYGGEEFALILRGIDITGARAAGERLRYPGRKAPYRVRARPSGHYDQRRLFVACDDDRPVDGGTDSNGRSAAVRGEKLRKKSRRRERLKRDGSCVRLCHISGSAFARAWERPMRMHSSSIHS